jgi:hypothetical protein
MVGEKVPRLPSKDIRVYHSNRGFPLLYMGLPLEVPVVTMENYTKWYRIYMVMPDGSVEDVSALIDEVMAQYPDAMMSDHCYHPRLLYRLAEMNKACVDERAIEVAAGRWVIEATEDTSYNFHDPSLD